MAARVAFHCSLPLTPPSLPHPRGADSLLLVPYLLLTLRPMRIYLTRAKATGYDRSGRLCAALTAVEKAQRAEEASSDAQAALRIQAAIRGKNARRELAAERRNSQGGGAAAGGGKRGSYWSRGGSSSAAAMV